MLKLNGVLLFYEILMNNSGTDKEFSITGVENDTKRRNQQSITDILRNINFSGGVRPRIEIQTLVIDNHEIDILIVKDSHDVPYYLENDYQDKKLKNPNGERYGKIVRAYHIYTRVTDNNTPIDKSADINDVEFLWRKRFGIELPIMERLHILLSETDKWNFDWNVKRYCHHTIYPEFQIRQVDEWLQGWHPAAEFYIHPTLHIAKLHILYHSTVIYETELWALDNFKKFLPKPKDFSLNLKENVNYFYYTLDSIEGKLLKIFTYGSCDISSREINSNQFLVFRNEEHKSSFDNYISMHFNDRDENKVKSRYQNLIHFNQANKSVAEIQSALQLAKILWLYEDWLKQEHF